MIRPMLSQTRRALLLLVFYVRTDAGAREANEHAPTDLLADGGSVRVTVDTLVARRADGPFTPLGRALQDSGSLRDVMAAAIPIPSLRDHRRLRFALLGAAALPMGMLLELDRELAFSGASSPRASPGRWLVDVILVAYVVFELTRRTPRMPGVAALALVAIGLRWTLFATRLCGHGVHPVVYAAAALAVGAAFVLLARVPSRARVALELLGKLGVTRSEIFAQTVAERIEPPGALIAASVACAAGLPAVLHLVRVMDGGLLAQAATFIAFAAVAPEVARRTTEPDGERRTSAAPARILMGFAIGMAVTAAAVTAGRLFFDSGAELARCVERLDTEAKRAIERQSLELAHAIAKVRASTALVMTTSVVFPFAEERIYRGLLQDVLSRKYGASYGIFAASIAFGVAHLGIYEIALYQTVLLGIGFGVAYAEGGLLAAFFVHATWNLMQLT